LLDIHWGDANLTGIDWSTVRILVDEQRARNPRTNGGKLKDRQERIKDYQRASRAYNRLSMVLQQQGMTEDAARFAYRGQVMQRKMFGYQGARKFHKFLFSGFLDLLSGYGYRWWRSFF